jgi:hypothetical protein
MKKTFVGPLLIVLALSACTSSGQVQVAKERSEAIRPGSTVALSVEAVEGSGNADHVQRGLQDLRGNLFANLPASGVFTQVVQEGQQADYEMDVDVTNVRFVSGSARFWGGVFAGANVVSGDVTLTDASNGLEVTKFSATGESASHPISSDSGFDSAVREFSTQVTTTLQ